MATPIEPYDFSPDDFINLAVEGLSDYYEDTK